MRMRVTVPAASLLGALALACRGASAQDSGSYVEGGRLEEMTSPAVLVSPSFEPGWWLAIMDALDAMRGLRGRRVPTLAARQVDLSAASAPTDLLTYWQELPQVTHTLPAQLDLRFGPVHGLPVRIEPSTAWVADLRDESGDLLGTGVTLPWLVP
jgi:hypothetical protein